MGGLAFGAGAEPEVPEDVSEPDEDPEDDTSAAPQQSRAWLTMLERRPAVTELEEAWGPPERQLEMTKERRALATTKQPDDRGPSPHPPLKCPQAQEPQAAP